MARPTAAGERWISEFRQAYPTWYAHARPLLEVGDGEAAFATYPFPALGATPWTPVWGAPEAARLGVVTTAALWRPGADSPPASSPEGDPRITEIPSDVQPGVLRIAHADLALGPAAADINVVLPLEHLHAMVREGRVADLAPRVFSIDGHRTRADEVAEETAPAIAGAMWEDGVTRALIIPVCPLCHQTGGLIAREIEASGIPTVTMANATDWIARVRPPRWARVPFPAGTMFGGPGNAGQQRRVLEEALGAFRCVQQPGGHVEVPEVWEDRFPARAGVATEAA
ncbi:MAG TPA: hypothetical protein VMG58_03970 [Candidatus Sulfotelmatobacter sp.]|nr:hypothetical protein [Candidatus Sulfotelmatobacter sp.]